jgi:hypothetical protein
MTIIKFPVSASRRALARAQKNGIKRAAKAVTKATTVAAIIELSRRQPVVVS